MLDVYGISKIAMTKEEKVKLILERLYKVYPHPKTSLNYKTPLQLLIATILSAQATDKLVNQVTEGLFKKYSGDDYQLSEKIANSSLNDFDKDISRVNFHGNKAKSIIASCKIIYEKYGGKVPDTIEELDALPGVARKTANVVLGNAFGKSEGVVVDTHVKRLSKKLGLTTENDPEKIEQDLMKIVPKEQWIDFSHLLIYHGRDICTARPHTCVGCPLGDICPDMKVK